MTYEEARARKEPFVVFSNTYEEFYLVYKLNGVLKYILFDDRGFGQRNDLSIGEWTDTGFEEDSELFNNMSRKILRKCIGEIFKEWQDMQDALL